MGSPQEGGGRVLLLDCWSGDVRSTGLLGPSARALGASTTPAGRRVLPVSLSRWNRQRPLCEPGMTNLRGA